MKNNKATENYYMKEPPCDHGNNVINKCSSYFDISQIKQLYAPQSTNGYEQIFSIPRKAKKTGRKSKKEISNTKGSISSFHSDQYENDKQKNPVPIRIGLRKKMKYNSPNEDSHFFYSNSFDQTPRKHFSFNHKDPQNDEPPNVYNPRGSVTKGVNKRPTSRSDSLNKYDFIRFVCSPTKKSVDNRSANCDSEMCSAMKSNTITNDNTRNDNTRNDSTRNDNTRNDNTRNDNTRNDNTRNENTRNDNTRNENTRNDNTRNENTRNDNTRNDAFKNHPMNIANCGEHTATSVASMNDPQRVVNNYVQWDQFFHPKTEPEPPNALKRRTKYDPNIIQNNDIMNDTKGAISSARKIYPPNESILNPKGGTKCVERVGRSGTTNSHTGEDTKSAIRNFTKHYPPHELYNDTDESREGEQERTPQNGAQNNGPIDLDSHDSIDRLSRNFFINNKKIFLTHFRKDKETQTKRGSNYSHSTGGNVPLRHDATQGERNKGKNEQNKWWKNGEEVTPGGESFHCGHFAKVNSPHCEEYIHSEEEMCRAENSSRRNYHQGEDQAKGDDWNEDDKHLNHDTRYSDEEPIDGRNFLPDMNSFVRKNCNVMKSLYSHLGVPYNGSKEEIKKSYKEKIKVHHPDKGGSVNKFLQLKLSYDILTNDKKRKMYDKYGHGILELLVSENFQNYEISSSDGENNQNEIIDEENIKIYNFFVQKYNNTSYLHNLQDLKMDSYQYNEFQKLIFHFFHHENPMFKNTFHLFPAYSPFVPPYRKKKTDKRKTDKMKADKMVEVEKGANGKEVDKKMIPHLDLSNSLDNTPVSSIPTKELFSSSESCTSRNYSPSNYSAKKECSINDVLSEEHVTNLFNEMENDFKYFYNKFIVHKIEESELAKNNSTYGKKAATKIVNPADHNNVEVKGNSDDVSTPMKEHTHHSFEQFPYDEDMATPLAQCQLSHEKHSSNRWRQREKDYSFRDIQTSPIAYKIINENNERHIADFYRWFELFFNHRQGDQAAKEAVNQAVNEPVNVAANEAAKEVPNHATQNHHRICSEMAANWHSGATTPIVIPPPKLQEEAHSAQTNEAHAKINSESPTKFQCSAENFFSFGRMPHPSSNSPNVRIKDNTQNEGKPTIFSHYKYAKIQHGGGGGTTPLQTQSNATPTRTNTTPRRSGKKNDKPNISREKSAHKITPLCNSSSKMENSVTINIEEKYGFNLLKRSEQKIKDITHDFNYIYIGSNMMKKNKFVLFVKEESVKKFLKVKLLIEKIKKKSNLKLISVFEKEIEKNIKHMEYILLLTTHKDEFLPLNDFYLLDRNAFTKDHYCIPLYIKKNTISRPTHFHIRWIVYTLQSLIFFNFFFKKMNKYMCAFPFFNYKYNLIKHFLDHEEKNNCSIHQHIKKFYIFFQQYIIKNKQHYLKYFPHSITLHIKNDASPNYQNSKPVCINMSSILVLTPNKPIPSSEW
ncbi:DnaJ protein, putative [Plasmodium knowlesi strain H]|uniref:DnaJ protein, putative n=3 Tax=Plasmodium knowlesi TaxID=5850 RepID=A0A5K1V1Q5_PLAKH|nr:DnaJ protein, putative [Plasmodium knowlesi strain H]OTN65893.1 putative DnaJ protein [Plasmodium knowlesi]CAA9987659.1 DnaJ protein, putative [Plasmodium knowlesi strain H]SBO26872.1 DnaJ protein, putative [Plasmodium knowlesi strain H]SBO29663.1 DnaJ protein, putative [Plasmodium knowlesi strain H]VVS77133.1 DnaJ protein, putative [Plasmodium knowlesi strain H]|eukprot:XP_002258657.1 DnaJ protein, putative [Plasmodium knowlesi strain H]